MTKTAIVLTESVFDRLDRTFIDCTECGRTLVNGDYVVEGDGDTFAHASCAEIERLTKHIAELEAERDQLRTDHANAMRYASELEAKLEANVLEQAHITQELGY